MQMETPSLRTIAQRYLRQALGDTEADFRDGQFEAIEALILQRKRLLVVQRTGWGKSMVYFLVTRLLRDQGRGPTLLISPLLALMRNQIEAAARIGVRALAIHSDNQASWKNIEESLARDEVDILLISPERLANDLFRQEMLPLFDNRIGLLVVDEAHCISDWGHDFRPDYRRIVRILRALPSNVPVLTTTATANDRVVADIEEQLGPDLAVLRGRLERKSLQLQAIRLNKPAERLGWLAEHLPRLPGSGIVYVRTVRDADRVTAWLRSVGLDAHAYYGGMANRDQVEQALLDNKIKVLVATSALGMGFDKPDLAFVIHYQRPGSAVEYYQQVGRAGRDGKPAYGVLLSGEEDDHITDYFIRSAFPPRHHVDQILAALDAAEDGLTIAELEETVNLSRKHITHVLKLMSILDQAPVAQERRPRTPGSSPRTVYRRTYLPYIEDERRRRNLERIRKEEQRELRRYMEGTMCHMLFLQQALNDTHQEVCGKCAVCSGKPLLPAQASQTRVQEALRFLKRGYLPIKPRRKSPIEKGLALSVYGDAGWGELVRQGKYKQGYFSDLLVQACREMFKNATGQESGEKIYPETKIHWMTCVPSLRHPELVPSFARRLAEELELPFVRVIEKLLDTPPQKEQRNSHHQRQNLEGAFKVEIPSKWQGKSVLLVDDMVDSRWTLTIIGKLLRQGGAGLIYPLALAESTPAEARDVRN